MSQLELWLQELYFEDNRVLQRRAARVASLITKSLLTVPHAFMFFFCNFASAMPTRRIRNDPRPREATLETVILQEWPRSAMTGFDRGLPHADSSVDALHLGTSLARVHDLAFVMSEIRRVCQPDAQVDIEFTDPDDPFQVRPITSRTVNYLCDATFVARDETDLGAKFTVKKERSRTASPRRIDIGCGSTPRAGYAGIDRIALPQVSIVRDVERHGLPFSDSTITHVHTAHFLEHTHDLVFVMNEIHRVCCHDALVTVSVPTLLGPFAAADPTHVHYFNARTFTYFEPGDEPYADIVKGFEILEQRVSFSLEVTLRVIKDVDMPSVQTNG